ncbi:periplasmic heavy metal sensor, partial [Caulobacter sp. 17J65-9]|uniref:periplasmic heavy metal sensor n=1 Tax=Caulobacter sp. 17J65-9 TaxID=2709382 RepID=UPI0013CCDB61
MTSRGLKIAFGVSLALNLFLIGVGLGGGAIAWKHWKDRPGAGPPLFEAARSLPESEQKALRQSMRAVAMKARPDFEQARTARREAVRIAAAPTFDRAAVAAQLDRSREAEIRGRVVMEQGVLDVMAGLSPKDRAALAPALLRKG